MTYAGLQTTCRDLARFGLLDRSTAATGTAPRSCPADFLAQATQEPSQEINVAYGWLWWLNQRGPIASTDVATAGPGAGGTPSADGQLLPGAPEDIFWAIGLFDQVVAVIPSEGIVAVRMGADPPAGSGFDRTTFTADVLAALTERTPT